MIRAGAFKAALAMVGIFVAGAAAGGFAGVAWYRSTLPTRFSTQDLADRHLRRVISEVHLTDDQTPRVRAAIMALSDRFKNAYGNVTQCFRDMNRAVEAELTPEQRELYRAMLERDQQRRDRDTRDRGEHRSPENRERDGEPHEKPPTSSHH